MSIEKLLSKYSGNTAFSNAPTEPAITNISDSDIVPTGASAATTGAEPNAENKLRQAIANFSVDLREKLRLVLAEMEGDLLTLKYRHFDKALFLAYGDIWKHLVKANKQYGFSDPIECAHEVISHVKNNMKIIENIEFMAKRHVDNTNVDVKLTKHMSHPKLRGLSTLMRFVDHIENELKKIETPAVTQKTWAPPRPKDLDVVPSLSIKPPSIG